MSTLNEWKRLSPNPGKNIGANWPNEKDSQNKGFQNFFVRNDFS